MESLNTSQYQMLTDKLRLLLRHTQLMFVLMVRMWDSIISNIQLKMLPTV